MSLRELLAGGGGVKSIQTGYVSSAVKSTGSTGEDIRFEDITISAVNASKSMVFFQGTASGSATNRYNAGSSLAYVPTARLTTSTNLRVSNTAPVNTFFEGRWAVVEYK